MLTAATLAVRALALALAAWVLAHFMAHYEIRVDVRPRVQIIQPAVTLENI